MHTTARRVASTGRRYGTYRLRCTVCGSTPHSRLPDSVDSTGIGIRNANDDAIANDINSTIVTVFTVVCTATRALPTCRVPSAVTGLDSGLLFQS